MKNSHNKRIVFADDPVELFAEWFALARQSEPNDPDAMSLATVSADGTPNVRMVLCKSFNHEGVRFFTNTESTKGQELANNPNAALCFHWKTLHRQVRVRGAVSKLPAADDDAYFHDRHRETQLGAWASAQSQPLDNMLQLIKRVYSAQERFHEKPVMRPPYWGGYQITPGTIEFWVEGQHRLHERMAYIRTETGWQQQRLYP